MSLDILNSLMEDVIATADVDMTVTSTGGGGGLMPAGFAMARMVTYIELGLHPDSFDEKKAPGHNIKVGFKLFGGEYEGRFISTFDLKLSNNEKAKTKQFFDKLNWDGSLRHFAQGLGRAYLVPITLEKNKQGKEVNRLNLGGILPPIDPVSKANYPVPELGSDDLRYFFFDKPTKESWDSLFVDGSWDDGGSKNVMQEKILKALNFPGSPLEQLISGVVLPELGAGAVPASDSASVTQTQPNSPEVPAAIGPQTAPSAPVLPTMPALPVMPS